MALFSRKLFGTSGAALATLIFFATAIYYAVFEGAVIAVAAHRYPAVPYWLVALAVVICSVLLIFGSVRRWLNKFNGVLLPFYLLGLLLAVVMATREYGYSDAWLSFGPTGGPVEGGWWDAFVYYMGVWILMMFTFDYARFGKREDQAYHSRFNFGMPFYLVTFLLNGVAGIYLVSTIPSDAALSEVSVVLALLSSWDWAACCSSGSRRPASIPPTTTWPPSTCRPSSRAFPACAGPRPPGPWRWAR